MNLFDLCVYKNLNKESGGDVDVSSLVATENKTYNAGEGKAYNPVVVNVPTPSPSLQSLTASHNGYFVPSSGYDGFDEVTVDVATPLETLSATENGTYTPSSGYEGFSEVTVDVPLPNNAYLLESQKNDVVTIQNGAEFDLPKLIVSIEPQQSGSGDPSPENVRPISGWTACNVVRSGANSWDEEWELGIYNTSTGEKQADNSRIRSKNYISVRPSNSYRIVIPSSAYCRYFCYDINKNLIITEVNQGSATITTPNNCYFMTFNMGQEYGTTYNDNISINYPSTDTSYHAYNGNTYTINFVDGSSPLTVYGGTLDVLSGVLTVDREYISDWRNYTFEANTNGNYSYEAYIIIDKQKGIDNIISNKLPVISPYTDVAEYSMRGYPNDDALAIKLPKTVATNADEVKQWMISNNITVCYELATPQTYQLTPTTEAKSLLGVNNIFADTGEVDVQIWTKEVTS